MTSTRDVGTHTPRQDKAITTVQTLATRDDRQHTGGATKPRTCASTRKTAAHNTLTGDDVRSCNDSSSGSNDGSSENTSSSSGSKDGDRRATTDDDLGHTEISLHTQKQDTQLPNIIDHLQNGNLLDGPKIARRLLLIKDNFVIRDDKLLHIGIKRRKKQRNRPANSRTALYPTNFAANATCTLPH